MGIVSYIVGRFSSINPDALACALAARLSTLMIHEAGLIRRVAAKQIAVNLIAPQMAALQLGVFRRDTGEQEDNDLAIKLNENLFADMTAYEGWAATYINLMGRNNAFCRIYRVGDKLINIRPVDGDRVAATAVMGVPTYVVDGQQVDASELLHLRWNACDGVIGMPYEEEVCSFDLAREAEAMARRYFSQGGNISRIWKLLPGATPDQEKAVQAFIDKAISGAVNQMKDVVVPMHVDKIAELPGPSARDSQMLETRQYQAKEILALWGIDLDDLDLEKIFNITIVPILANVEQAITARLLSPADRAQYRVAYLVAGRFRGSEETQWNMADKAAKALSPNEIRKWFNYAPKGPEYDAIINPNTASGGVNEARHDAAAGGQ